jgi:hypothetical protein
MQGGHMSENIEFKADVLEKLIAKLVMSVKSPEDFSNCHGMVKKWVDRKGRTKACRVLYATFFVFSIFTSWYFANIFNEYFVKMGRESLIEHSNDIGGW